MSKSSKKSIHRRASVQLKHHQAIASIRPPFYVLCEGSRHRRNLTILLAWRAEHCPAALLASVRNGLPHYDSSKAKANRAEMPVRSPDVPLMREP